MKYFFVCFLLLILLVSVNAGDITLSAGINNNSFFKVSNDDFVETEYTDKIGFSFGIGIEGIKVYLLNTSYVLKYVQYGGDIYTHEYVVSHSFATNAETKKSIITLGIYPVNIKIFSHRLCVTAGFESNTLIFDKTTGTKSGVLYPVPESEFTLSLEENNIEINKRIIYGICGSAGYEIFINEKFKIRPRYLFYYGLTTDFINIEAETKSLRHNFEIVLIKSF